MNGRKLKFSHTLAAITLAASVVFGMGAAHAAQITILNVSYDPTRELYEAVNALSRSIGRRNGNDVNIKQSHGGSGKQARAVIDGSRRTS